MRTGDGEKVGVKAKATENDIVPESQHEKIKQGVLEKLHFLA